MSDDDACRRELARRRAGQTPEIVAAARAAHAIELEQWLGNKCADDYLHLLSQERNYWVYHRDDGSRVVCGTPELLALSYYETQHGKAHHWPLAPPWGIIAGTPCSRCGTLYSDATAYLCCPGPHE